MASPFILAPMMDLAGFAFRTWIRQYGGCGLTYSEMLNATRIPYENHAHPLYRGFGQDHELIIQLAGCEAESLKRAVECLEEYQPAGFDLNLGCSRASIIRRGWGAALLRDWPRARAAVRAMRAATARIFTAKIRMLGSVLADAQAFVAMLEDEGIDALVLHSRTPEKIFTRPARWAWIGEIKSRARIPVIGNGDVQSSEDAIAMMRETGCDGVMVGRAAVAKPYLFRDALSRLRGQTPGEKPSASAMFDALVATIGPELNEPKRMREFRHFCRYFAEGLPVPHWFWGPLQGVREPQAMIRKAREFLNRNQL